MLLQVLILIEYAGNKEQFIDDFLVQAQKQAAINILSILPQEKREELQKEEENKELFAEIFTPEVMDAALVDAMVLQFQGFLQTIIPTLSQEKKDALMRYLDSLSPEESTKN